MTQSINLCRTMRYRLRQTIAENPSVRAVDVADTDGLLENVMLLVPPIASAGGDILLRATAGTAIARLSHRNLSVCLSVCPSVRHTGGSGKNGAS